MRIPEVYEPELLQLKTLHHTLGLSQVSHQVEQVKNEQYTGRSYRHIAELLDTLAQGNVQTFSLQEWTLLMRYTPKWGEQAYRDVIAESRSNAVVSNKLLALFLKEGGKADSPFCKNISQHKKTLISLSEQWSVVLRLWSNEKGYAESFLCDLANKPNFRKKHLGQRHMEGKDAWLWKRIGKQRLIACLLQLDAFKTNQQGNIDDVIQRWFIPCLNEVYRQNKTYAISIVKELANKLFHKNRVSKLLAVKLQVLAPWLNQHVSISSDKTVWKGFSNMQREVLTMIMGETTYKEFKSVVLQLAKECNEKESRRLKSRSGFWEGYKQYFLTFNVFASRTSFDFLKRKEVEVKPFYAPEDTVVCVMETEKWMIVEFLSGSNTDVFVYPYSFREQLTGDNLNDDVLKDLKPEFIHDHYSWWQPSLYTMLKGVGMIGLDTKGNKWSNKTLNQEEFQQREAHLIRENYRILTVHFNKLIECLHDIKE